MHLLSFHVFISIIVINLFESNTRKTGIINNFGFESVAAAMQDEGVVITEITGRKILDVIEKVGRDSADCKLAKELKDLPRLDIEYTDTKYSDQVRVAVQTSNILSDLLPSGSGREKCNTTLGKSILETNSEVMYSLVRSNVESDFRLLGSGIVFDINAYNNFTFFAPYAFRDTKENTVQVKDLSTSWSVLHPVWLEHVHNVTRGGKNFRRQTSIFIERYNATNDGGERNVSHPFVSQEDGLWTQPYFDCGASKVWQITYTVPFIGSFVVPKNDRFV